MPSIRPVALAVPRRGADVLVFEYRDSTKDETFYRPLGGGIEFGETAEAAVRRELREELDADLLDVRLLGVLENLFHAFGCDGHEIVFVFDCRLADQSLYERDAVGEIRDDAGTKVMWRPLNSFDAGSPLYPAGLTELLHAESAVTDDRAT
ncbi:NUDIX domain-containing protein [Micromonospora sp. WMMA1947]|uniref:NUDIX hydrolase n=1 Tax=Micromonospora sp. WMMA1947 TaxID=3015163 RepID=UPI00248BB830|nr:NUDIX domain-containing protein [Micromonospora sp. WMMA1947]WBC11087.1 NUDIX domain-containing protein [Micromonospora sp. WMMA1947]